MSEDKNKIEKELRANKIEVIHLLTEKMVALDHAEFKDYKIEEDMDIPHLNATIKILKIQVKKATENKAKLFKFDKIEEDRKNLTPEQLKQLQEEQERINKKVDSFLATLEPRCTLRGNIASPNTIILRYRGKGIDDEFSKKYPFGVVL